MSQAEEPVAALLNLLWSGDQSKLRSEGEAFASFRSLLGWLGERQSILGLELLGRVGGLA